MEIATVNFKSSTGTLSRHASSPPPVQFPSFLILIVFNYIRGLKNSLLPLRGVFVYIYNRLARIHVTGRGTMAGEQFNTGYYRVTRHQGRRISPSFPEITHSTRCVSNWHFNSRSSRGLGYAVGLEWPYSLTSLLKCRRFCHGKVVPSLCSSKLTRAMKPWKGWKKERERGRSPLDLLRNF